jgi:enterochelin esterase-like enzyme
VPSASLPPAERTLEFSTNTIGKICVVVWLPERSADQKLPLLIALHGRGETLKGPARGARGWLDDYALARAASRLRRPPLTQQDFQGFVEADRLVAFNTALGREPFAGVAVACPYLPDILSSEEPFTGAEPYAAFLVERLLPQLRAEFPLIATPAATGIDGVSLGGRAAVAVGLLRPDAFGAIGGLQSALDPRNSADLTRRARDAFQRNPRLQLRLLTSTEDYYLAAHKTIHRALRDGGVPHGFRVVPGPHDYVFNRGPGAIEMLVYHDRVLRGREPI